MKKGKAAFVLFLLLFMMVFLNADQMVMSPNIGEIEAEFGITKADIGLIQGSFTIVGALISLLWGFLADKYSCLLYTSPSPRDRTRSRMPSSA